MLKIDGDKIRSLRESQGVTQLFLATSVEVTTDTISRWENKRYPTIKKENALKLAAALEVDIADILLDEEGEDQEIVENKESIPVIEEEKAPPEKEKNILFIPLLLLLAGIAAWLLWPSSSVVNVRGRRILPAHTPGGQPFPVAIRIDINSNTDAVSLILKEIVPAGVRVMHGSPDFSTIDRHKGLIKWIKKIDRDMVFGYLACTEPDYQHQEIKFSGAITLRRKGQQTKRVHGDERLEIAPFHWADSNMDNKISDEEILVVYDEYSDLKGLGLDIDQIEEMWLGGGYGYDQEQHKFIIKE
jgi:transcriptional regulator with XRE-family HTH domain